MNFKQKRELFEKQSGGKRTLVYDSEFIDKHTEEDHYREPNCVCAQKSKIVYRIKNKITNNIHWVGTCCINEYLDMTEIGGTYYFKQGSYEQLAQAVEKISANKEQKPNFYDIIVNLQNKFIDTEEDKEKIELLLGGKVRFKTREFKDLEHRIKQYTYRNIPFSFKKYNSYMIENGYWEYSDIAKNTGVESNK